MFKKEKDYDNYEQEKHQKQKSQKIWFILSHFNYSLNTLHRKRHRKNIDAE